MIEQRSPFRSCGREPKPIPLATIVRTGMGEGLGLIASIDPTGKIGDRACSFLHDGSQVLIACRVKTRRSLESFDWANCPLDTASWKKAVWLCRGTPDSAHSTATSATTVMDSTSVTLRANLDEAVEDKPRRRHSINMLCVFVSREVAQSTGQCLNISHPKQVIDVVAPDSPLPPWLRICSKPCKVPRRVHWTEVEPRKPWSSSCWSLFYLQLFGRNDHLFTSIAFLSIYRANGSGVLDCLPSPVGGVSRRPYAGCRPSGACKRPMAGVRPATTPPPGRRQKRLSADWRL